MLTKGAGNNGRFDPQFNIRMPEMDSHKSKMYVYYFMRYSLMLYPFLAFLFILAFCVELPWAESLTNIFLIVALIPIVISFMILPGIIYEGEYKYAFHGFGKNQIKYDLFLALTLGFGPVYIFFKKYDPILKEHFDEAMKSSDTTILRTPGLSASGCETEMKKRNMTKHCGIIIAALVLPVLVVIGTQFILFKVSPSEDGVIVRNEKIIAIKPPGLHWKIPFLDVIHKIPSRRSHRVLVSPESIKDFQCYVNWQVTDKEKYYWATKQFVPEERIKSKTKTELIEFVMKNGAQKLGEISESQKADVNYMDSTITHLIESVKADLVDSGIGIERIEVVKKMQNGRLQRTENFSSSISTS